MAGGRVKLLPAEVKKLGVDETQAIHIALHDMAMRVLPQYEADDCALTAAQLEKIKQQAAQGKNRSASSIRSSLFELKTA